MDRSERMPLVASLRKNGLGAILSEPLRKNGNPLGIKGFGGFRAILSDRPLPLESGSGGVREPLPPDPKTIP
jgi:hypothetical protein